MNATTPPEPLLTTPRHGESVAETSTAGFERSLRSLLADPERAAVLAAQALALAESEADAAAQALAHLAMALAALRSGQAEQGRHHLDAAQRCMAAQADAQQADDPRVLRAGRLARRVQAELLRREGQHDEALAMLQALEAESASGADIDLFFIKMLLGTLQALSDHMPEALGSFYAGLDLAQRMGEPSLEVNALNNLGSLQLDLHNLEDALPLLRRCLHGALQIDSRRQRIFAAGNLLQCLCAMGQAAEALSLAREHLIPVILPDDPPSLHRDEEIAEALIDNGCVDEALAYLSREAQQDVLTNPMTALRSWLLARMLLAQARPADAWQLCQAQAAGIDDDEVVPLYRLRLCEISAESAALCGDHAAAYALLRKAQRLQDVLLGRAARARFVSLQIAHELQTTRRERDVAIDLAHRLEQVNMVLRGQVEANEALQRQLRALALEDPLTGLHNRRHLFQVGPLLVERAAQPGAPDTMLAVALIDLDHFKSVNDRHGHDAGDQVLRAFAELLRQAMRKTDLCCRYGGEEFVAVWYGLDAAHAVQRLDALQQQVGLLRFDGAAGERFGCSFSAGVAETFGDGDSLPALLAAADAALYRAKAAGRQRVCRASPGAGHIEAASIAR